MAGREVVILPSADGRRFALLVPDELMGQLGVQSASDFGDAMERLAASLPWLSEPDLRARLAGMGLVAAEIDDRIGAARRRLAVMTSAPTTIERITATGYRNADGQTVVRRTRLQRADGQRVYLVQCGVCGHGYGAYGCDLDLRHCPRCQDGPPGLPVS